MSPEDRLKEEGDRLYRNHAYNAAVDSYSEAIGLLTASGNDNTLYVCYSNRCACFLQLKRYQEALHDAQQCVSIRSDWPKGYLRLGSCHSHLGNVNDAIAAYEQVCQLDPGNSQAKKALGQLRAGGFQGGSARAQPSFLQSLQQRFNSIDWQSISRSIQTTASNAYYKAWAWWMSLDGQVRQYIQIGMVILLIYWFFFRRSYSYGGYDDYDYHEPSYSYRSYGGGGMSWTTWALIMYGAYKLPPMFPAQLGQYAQPFFGMNWTTFMWLLNMLTRSGVGGYRPRGGGMFFPRRRYY